MNCVENPQLTLLYLRKIESLIYDDLHLWKTEMSGELASTYIQIRQEQLEAVQQLERQWLNFLNS